MSEQLKLCPVGSQRCLCQDCKNNAAYEDCNSGYCIYCYECMDKGSAVHDVYLCTGHERKKETTDDD